jgi:hypothetical protein
VKYHPDAWLIACVRGGTTSLFYNLKQHPQFYPKDMIKEPFLFAWAWPGSEEEAFESARRLYAHPKGTFNLDGSIDYLSLPWVVERIYRFQPDAKFIVMLRNPVDRAYANWDLLRKTDPRSEPLTFKEAIEEEAKRIPGGFESLLHNPTPQQMQSFRIYSFLERGKYARLIKQWLKYFPLERFKFIKSKDYFDNPSVVYHGVLDYLDVPRWTPRKFVKMFCITKPDESDPAPMADDLRDYLVEYFRPFNKELYDLLGRDFNWENERTL